MTPFLFQWISFPIKTLAYEIFLYHPLEECVHRCIIPRKMHI